MLILDSLDNIRDLPALSGRTRPGPVIMSRSGRTRPGPVVTPLDGQILKNNIKDGVKNVNMTLPLALKIYQILNKISWTVQI